MAEDRVKWPVLVNAVLNTEENNFYCCTVHFDNIKIPFTNKCTLLLNTYNVKTYS